MAYSLGIDLGTTFSAAAVARDGQVEVLSLGYRAPTIPSVIVARETGEILIGEAAERRALLEPLRTAREFKRRLGDPTPILLGSAPYGAETLMSYLLRGIYDRVIEQQGEEPASLVVSHPANWGLYKLDLLEQAVRMADVGQARYITEPIAAALHYAGRERIEPGETVAVYDFGGGTFDAALLRRTEASFEPLGEPEGLERLGGIDFDEAVFAHVLQSIADLVQDLDPNDTAAMAAVARLREECRAAKEALSVDTDVIIPVLLPNIQTEVRLTRSEFEEMVEPRIGATLAALRRAARSAGLDLSEVDRILLVGGSSRIPLVRQRVREETNGQIYLDAHPKYAIALGAAIAADLNLGTTTTARMTAGAASAVAPAQPVDVPPPEPAHHEPEPAVGVPADPSPAPERLPETDPAPPSFVEPESPEAEEAPAAEFQPAPPPSALQDALDDALSFEPQPAEAVAPEAEIVPPGPVADPRPAAHVPQRPAFGADTEPAPVNPESIASSQWQDGIALSPVLVGGLVAAALISAIATYLLLVLLVG